MTGLGSQHSFTYMGANVAFGRSAHALPYSPNGRCLRQ